MPMALIKGQTCLHSSPFQPKKFLIFIVNGVLCYFSPLVILQRNVKVSGRNVDRAKVQVKVGVENFLSKAFERFNVAIWPCMNLEDVLEVLPIDALPNSLIDSNGSLK
jgi:hypothetical protein